MLETLPHEILSIIIRWLPLIAIRVLSQVSSKLHSALVPQIYRQVTFGAASEWALNVLDVDSFFLHHDFTGIDCLQHTRHLSIYAAIQVARFNRCAFYNIFRTGKGIENSAVLGTSNEARAHEQFLEDISDQLRLVFKQLKTCHLQSFKWRLGTCIAAGVLDKNGYLIQHQSSLAHLSLVTDGSCPNAGCHLDGLGRLSNLRTLEWEGIQHPFEIRALQKCIGRNQIHLTGLSIGFNVTATAPEFDSAILGLNESSSSTDYPSDPDPDPVSFPFLTFLTLSRAALPPILQPKLSSILSSLNSLKLRDCANTFLLLDGLSRTSNTMQLQVFEFCCENSVFDRNHQRGMRPMVDFLLSFHGLKHLYLKLSNFADSSHVQAVLQHHGPTLESLAYHEQQLTRLHDEGPWWDTRDYSPAWAFSLSKILKLHQLAAFAFCASPSILRTSLEPVCRNSSVEALHIRFTGLEKLHRDIRSEILSEMRKKTTRSQCHGLSGEEESSQLVIAEKTMASFPEAKEYVQFADWAFGPTGLPKLQILAFGDFSHEERYSSQRFLARRAPDEPSQQFIYTQDFLAGHSKVWNFCEVEITDSFLLDRVDFDWTCFLSVCPESGLMESPDEW